MSNPKHTLFWMTTFLAVVTVVCALLFKPLQSAFLANWVFNLVILCVLLVGIVLPIAR